MNSPAVLITYNAEVRGKGMKVWMQKLYFKAHIAAQFIAINNWILRFLDIFESNFKKFSTNHQVI